MKNRIPKVLFINVKYSQGGAAIIARSLFELLKADCSTSFIYGYGKGGRQDPNAISSEIKMTSSIVNFILNKLSYNIIGRDCFTSNKKFITKMIVESDIVFLHAIHSHYLNDSFLINTIIKYNKSIIWTFHDSWVFTGRCALPYQCEGFLYKCEKCEILNNYPSTLIANNKLNFIRKRKLLIGIPEDKLTIVCPSEWLAETARQTFLNKFPILNIPNGIDLKKFSFQQKMIKKNEKLRILFISNYVRDTIKGADFFFNLVERCPNVEFNVLGYFDKKCPEFPNLNYHGYINNSNEILNHFNSNHLSVFFSKYDNYPTVILESLSTGTPVIAFKGKGNKEIFKGMNYPYLINDDDFDAAFEIVKSLSLFDFEKVKEYEKISLEGRIQVERNNKLKTMYESYSSLIKSIYDNNNNNCCFK